jgi:hypothetical protein
MIFGNLVCPVRRDLYRPDGVTLLFEEEDVTIDSLFGNAEFFRNLGRRVPPGSNENEQVTKSFRYGQRSLISHSPIVSSPQL